LTTNSIEYSIELMQSDLLYFALVIFANLAVALMHAIV